MLFNHDMGASLYNTWTAQQKREEIVRLVEGYRNGLPIGILCKMTETIAGGKKQAKRHLVKLLTLQERQAAVDGAAGGMQELVKSFML